VGAALGALGKAKETGHPKNVILHVDAETAATWSERQIIGRWTTRFSAPSLVERYLSGQNSSEAADKKARGIIEEWRTHLTDISWFMRVPNGTNPLPVRLTAKTTIRAVSGAWA